MRRRQFIALIGAASTWPFISGATENALPVIGFVHPSSAVRTGDVMEAFNRGLGESGYVVGKDVTIEYHWANDDYALLPGIFRGLADRKIAVMFVGTPVAAKAAKRAGLAMPIVFCIGSDPVKDGIVMSLSQPGDNITGTTFFGDLLGAKRLELLRQLSGSRIFAVLVNPANLNAKLEIEDVTHAALSLNLQLVVADATNEVEIANAFVHFHEKRAGSVLVASDAFLNLHAKQIANLAIQYGLTTCFSYREPVEAGGLMSYGASRPDAYRRAASYVARILRGERASDLPVQQPSKYEFVLNLKTAKALGLKVPASTQLLADEVIE